WRPMIPSSRPKPPTLLGCTSIHPNMQRCSAWMKKQRFRRWIVKTRCCRSPRAEPSVTALSTTVMARFRFLPLSTPARAMSWAKPLSATLRRSSWPSSLTSWPINPSVKRSTSSPIISPPTKPRRWRNSLLVIPTFICILPRRIPPGSIKSNCGSPRSSAMSSREGFSPRSRTWIKNSCATSVNTTKNPKPLNGSTSIQPVESLANQLLQLTRFLLPSLLLVAAFDSATLADAQERVRAGYSGISGYQVPLWLGVDLGLFKKYGVNLEPILFRGGAESANALTGGEIQFDVVAPQPHIAADLSGADIIIIGTYFNKHTYSVVARPGIRAPQELRGKKIGVLSVVGLNQIVVAAALRHWGMDEKSVTLVRSGGSRDRLA